jgi:hypothetical protein
MFCRMRIWLVSIDGILTEVCSCPRISLKYKYLILNTAPNILNINISCYYMYVLLLYILQYY